MTLFTIVKEVMDANGWPAPTTAVATSQDQNMRQCFALLNGVLEGTCYKKNWPQLVREYQFNTVSGDDGYVLPADFHHLCAPSAYNANQYYAMKGSLPPAMWYRSLYAGYGDQWFDSFRLNMDANEFKISPTPSSPEKVVFAYITKNLVKGDDGTPKHFFVTDSDVPLIDEYVLQMGLSWRWRQKKGLDFTAELAEYNSAVRERFAQFLGTGEIMIGGNRFDLHGPLTNGSIGTGPIGL